MQKSLIAVGGTNHGKVVPVIVNEFRIGRDAMCHLRPASTDISRLHCAIVTHPDGRVFVRDYGGNNGTLINQRFLIGGEYEMKDGDLLEIGPLVFRFHNQGEAATTLTASSMTATSAIPPMAPVVRAPVPPPLPRPMLPGLTTISSVPRYQREESALETSPEFISDSNIFSLGGDGYDEVMLEPGRRSVDAGPKLVRD
jgi:predicted component of type VI protein secretion system